MLFVSSKRVAGATHAHSSVNGKWVYLGTHAPEFIVSDCIPLDLGGVPALKDEIPQTQPLPFGEHRQCEGTGSTLLPLGVVEG